MSTPPTIAAIRFGTGLSPRFPPPQGAEALMAELAQPDTARTQFPVSNLAQTMQLATDLREARKLPRTPGDGPRRKALRLARLALKGAAARDLINQMQRAVQSPLGFRERLATFWANHFTVIAKNGAFLTLPSAFADEAIRPNLTGRFSDMLVAAVTHPAMLLYLDQNSSIGPDSVAARRMEARRNHKVGLNENLAREVLELHTLGVGAPYTQHDVRQFAKLLTGLGINSERGFVFRPAWAEPGAETVLGRRYGGESPARLSDITAALDDIARNPATAHHLATKLAVHFVSDTPDPALVAAMTRAYEGSDGDLTQVYAAMLAHPAAWAPLGGKVRQPWDFMAASLRALGTPENTLAGLDQGRTNRLIAQPLKLMGQPWQRPAGPDGWHEDADAWITPQGLAARIDWAMRLGRMPELAMADTPDPRAFVQSALGDAASPVLVRASARAESRAEGVGLILASADFNRR